jgi:hypothetical protein
MQPQQEGITSLAGGRSRLQFNERNLDVGDDEHPGDYYDNTDGDHEKVEKGEPIGVQQAINKVITERLAEEVRENNTSADTWLLNHLRENEWWIRKEHAHSRPSTEIYLFGFRISNTAEHLCHVAQIANQIRVLATMDSGRIILGD